MKVLHALICVTAVFVLATGAFADGRSVADGPLQIVEPQLSGIVAGSGNPSAATGGGGGGCETVYKNFADGDSFVGRGQQITFYDDLLLGTEGDLSLFRELVSYRIAGHRRTVEPPDFQMTSRLRLDVNGDASGGPVEGPAGVIPGTVCVNTVGTLNDNPGVVTDFSLLATCLVGGDSGINLDEGFWMGFTNSPTVGGPVEFNGGWTIAGGPTTIGSSADVFAIENSDGTYTFASFGGDPVANFNASVCAQVVPAVPTVSEWGLIAIVLLVLTGGSIVIRKARPRTVSA